MYQVQNKNQILLPFQALFHSHKQVYKLLKNSYKNMI